MKNIISKYMVTIKLSLTILLSSSKLFAMDRIPVLVEPVDSWNQFISTNIYCSVAMPPLHQISSHAEAELTHVKPTGSIIRAGELAAKQDDFYLNQEIEIIRTDIETTKIHLNYAEEELGRLVKLRVSDMVSPSHLNNLKLDVDTHRLTKQRLEEQLKIAEYRLKKLKHFAQADSQVLSIEANPGERLNPGQKIMQLLPITTAQVECSIPEEHLDKNDIERNSSFKLEGQDIALRNISYTVHPETQNLNLYFEASREKFQSLLVGQRFEMTVLTSLSSMSQQELITKIPSDAVLLEGHQYKVWAVNSDKRIVSKDIQIIDTLQNHFIVRSTIKPGDLLVVKGHEGLEPNQAVSPTRRTAT
ncbi:efflux RND transporter periplasmic adaptor subunit [Microbulbifer sp. TRSA001]|uniref:efflux RND transporter periplasmic adaptor subunit n=1 Tax=unclassified Microbulbifer TaxID=2619833 RepID=UPI0024ADB0AD|nr:efflux RND transporter periplasmic adaptor subunit [Microbulbifer sp. VAAF005]WHI47991.1 efflux RND transporter periplasmic adaptor subunit [Microbulbifer sp. VAAF005]